jgi:PAS domain S-box-containing protein
MSARKPGAAGKFQDRVNEFLVTKNWDNTRLGPWENWSQNLRFAIGLCLNSELPTAIWWGEDLICIYNESFRDLLGLSHWEGLGSSGTEILGLSVDMQNSLHVVLQEGVPIARSEQVAVGDARKILTFYNSPISDPSGKVAGIFSVVLQSLLPGNSKNDQRSETTIQLNTDPIHPKQWEANELEQHYKELRRSNERYTKMIEEVEDYAIILLDVNGTILNWNRGAQKIKGYTEDEIIGRDFSIFYLDEDRARQLPQKLIQTAIKEGRATHEGFRKRRDDTKFWGSVVITALHDERGQVIGFTKVTRDLTERKAAEDLIRQHASELEVKNRQLEQFAYIASHDLQEPLRKIQTFVQILEKKFDNEEVRKKYFAKINTSAKRMTELIRSVLHYSRLAQPDELVTDVDLNDILENILGDYEVAISEKYAEIKHDVLPIVPGIRSQLGQLFANLIGNALKFTKGRPKISITWKTLTGVEVQQQFSAANLSNKYIELRFADNGIGFDQEYTDKIFSIFQRLNNRDDFAGTGIGLALSKKIVENHHGYITAESEVGKGSTFIVYLPYK